MSQSLLLLGRQPSLGMAELESLHGAAGLRLVRGPGGTAAAVINTAADTIDFDRLGGSIKLARVLTTLSSIEWSDAQTYLLNSCVKRAADLPEGKLQIGISAYGLRVTPQRLLATGLNLKKALKQAGRSVRLVPNKELALNSASVLHNHLTGPTGWEFVFFKDGDRMLVAQTVAEQDIDSYTVRDRDRPMRDARVGMLPPKLAQIIINLSTGQNQPSSSFQVLDPFCGTGVVLIEALLMGYAAAGSDIEPRMIEYTGQNLDWLTKRYGRVESKLGSAQLGDATDHQWTTAGSAGGPMMTVGSVASETYLGKPFTTTPSPEVLNQTVTDCNLIIKKFLRNIHPQLKRSTRLCLAVPAWQTRPGQFKHLPLLGDGSGRLDSLRDLGYNRISFEHAANEDLVYFRADQTVARELLILEKL